MEENKIQRKVLKSKVELRVQKEDGSYEIVESFPNKMQAMMYAREKFKGKAFTLTSVQEIAYKGKK